MSKEKVIEYVMNSPHNTNRAVLEGLLDDIGEDNPNEVQIINSTADNPFNTIDVSVFKTQLENYGASAIMTFDASAFGTGNISAPVESKGVYITINGGHTREGDDEFFSGFVIDYNPNGTLKTMQFYNNGTLSDMSAYASTIPTTLTIVWHPLS